MDFDTEMTPASLQESTDPQDMEAEGEDQKEDAKMEEEEESKEEAKVELTPEEIEARKEERKRLEEQMQTAAIEKYNNLIEQAMGYKDEGNQFFKEGNFQKAKAKYTRVFAFTKTLITATIGEEGDEMVNMASKMAQKGGEVPDELQIKAKHLERDVNLNMAMVFLKEKNYTKAIEKASKSLRIEKTTKGFFRRGKAYVLKNDYENAYKDFEEGKKLDENSQKLFDDEIAKAKKKEKDYDKKQAQKYLGFFDKPEQDPSHN